jgi:hypothetical protein
MGGTIVGSAEALLFVNATGGVGDFSMNARLRAGHREGLSWEVFVVSGGGEPGAVDVFSTTLSTVFDLRVVTTEFCNDVLEGECAFGDGGLLFVFGVGSR